MDPKRNIAGLGLLALLGCSPENGEAPGEGSSAAGSTTGTVDTTSTVDTTGTVDTTTDHSEDGECAQPECMVPDRNDDVLSVQTCSDAPPTGSSGLIDDFEDGDVRIVEADGRRGEWYAIGEPPPAAVVAQVVRTAGNSVMHLTGTGFHTVGAVLANPGGAVACAYDASRYTGIRLRARGNVPLRVAVQNPDTIPASIGGRCSSGDNCFDRHGATLPLGPEWVEYSLPFCDLVPAGWGGAKPPVDPSALVTLDFSTPFGSTTPFDLWIDDVALIEATGDETTRCSVVCPLESVPEGVQPTPEVTSIDPETDVQLYTFEQPTRSCGALVRRYLVYVPDSLTADTDAPVLIVLHGTGADAESMLDFMTQGRFQALADRDGFVVVYGNAAPSPEATTSIPNGGVWVSEPTAANEVDDDAYLRLVVDDLVARSIIRGENQIYLAGLSNGGGMAYHAALRAPNRYTGVAAIMPYLGAPPPNPETSSFRRVLLAYTAGDPGLPPGYHETLAALPAQWASALNLANTPTMTALPDLVVEGQAYEGAGAVPLATRDSRGMQFDYASETSDASLRVLVFDRAGHFWPVPQHRDPAEVLERWGFRNQDIDIADEIWGFFEPPR